MQTMKIVLFCLCVSSAVLASSFHFTTVDVPSGVDTFVLGINARGDVVGFYDDKKGATHGFLLHRSTFLSIDFPGALSTLARAINARGDIVGTSTDLAGVDHGYLLRDGRYTQIDVPEASATIARGINNAGDITGNYKDSSGNESGFLLKNGRYYRVRVPNSCSTDVLMPMDDGRVLVGDFCTITDGALHGFLRNRSGQFQTIDVPNAGRFACTAPRWINERGDIVGLYLIANTSDECYGGSNEHGFLIRDGEYSTIDFPGAAITDVLGINDDGELVGLYIDSSGLAHGFKAVPVKENN